MCNFQLSDLKFLIFDRANEEVTKNKIPNLKVSLALSLERGFLNSRVVYGIETPPAH